jgi:Amt family ammonium transporter
LLDFAVSTIAYFFIGYSIAYGIGFWDSSTNLMNKSGYELVKLLFPAYLLLLPVAGNHFWRYC